MTTDETPAIRQLDVAVVALDKEHAAQKVAETPIDAVPGRILSIRTLRAALSFLEGLYEDRWGKDGERVWVDPETNLTYEYGAVRRGEFRELPALIAGLIECGCSPVSVYRAVSGMRVTDLQAAVDALPDDKRSASANLLAEYRVWVEGKPKLQAKDHPVRKGKEQ